MPDTWTIDPSRFDANRLKRYAKKHPQEVASCFNNLDLVLRALNQGTPFNQLSFGFFRPEGENLWRIGQTKVPHAKETRLYVYVRIVETSIFPLTIGDKDGQPDDIRACKETIRNWTPTQGASGGERK